MKIVYKINNGIVVGWSHKLVDDTTYTLKPNEVFGDLFKKPILDNGVVIEGWTQTDQNNEDQLVLESSIDLDNTSLKEKKFRIDGIQAYMKLKKYIRRQLDTGVITQVQFDNIYIPIKKELVWLNTGDWDIAKQNIDAIPPPTNSTLLGIYNRIKNKIDNYIINNY